MRIVIGFAIFVLFLLASTTAWVDEVREDRLWLRKVPDITLSENEQRCGDYFILSRLIGGNHLVLFFPEHDFTSCWGVRRNAIRVSVEPVSRPFFQEFDLEGDLVGVIVLSRRDLEQSILCFSDSPQIVRPD